jgi:inhibitor of KinA
MQPTKSLWQVHLLGDHAVLFSLPEQISHEISFEVHRLNLFLQSQQLNFVKDIIPSYHTIVVVYDILQIPKDVKKYFESLIHHAYLDTPKLTETKKSKIIEIPVCYDIAFGIDLENISRIKNISIEQIIQTHCNTMYDVYAIGFLPGFTYMGIVDEKIQMPRHQTPRKLVAAGSVGIAGMQTGIYPIDSPGGWQIIGKTPIKMFTRAHLSFCNVGDVIQFKPIDMTTFNQLNES